MQEIRAGIIGLGGFFKGVHVHCLRRVAGLRIVAACDLREANRAEACKLLGETPKIYSDHRDLLSDQNVNAVYILTQAGAMLALVKDAAAAGKPIFCEKPPGDRSAEAREMAAAAANVPHMVAFNRRFGPFTDKVRQWLSAAGKPTRIETTFRRVFNRSPQQLVGNGIHGIDLTISLMGPVKRVFSALAAQRPGQGHCHFNAALQFASGASGTFIYDNRVELPVEEYHISAVAADTMSVEHIDLTFPSPTKDRKPSRVDRKKIVYKGWENETSILDITRDEFTRPDLRGDDELLIGGGYQAEHDIFAAALLNGTTPSPGFAQAIHSMEVAEAIQAGEYREF